MYNLVSLSRVFYKLGKPHPSDLQAITLSDFAKSTSALSRVLVSRVCTMLSKPRPNDLQASQLQPSELQALTISAEFSARLVVYSA